MKQPNFFHGKRKKFHSRVCQKSKGIKIFFYPINVDIRRPVQLFLLTCVENFFGQVSQDYN